MISDLDILKLKGPILVLGGSGFIGANLLLNILRVRSDVIGTTRGISDWRLEDIPQEHIVRIDLLAAENLKDLLAKYSPKTIFNCLAYGAYSFEQDPERIYETNFMITSRVLNLIKPNETVYVHAGSSSEYGDNCAGPKEESLVELNSDYAVSKFATSQLINYYGKKKNINCVNLRLYSVYGPLEDSSRLVPQLVIEGVKGSYPHFVNPAVSRDFVFIEDACDAFIQAANNLKKELWGNSYNIGTGIKSSIKDIALLQKKLFNISQDPVFGEMDNRRWDLKDWYSDSSKVEKDIAWKYITPLEDGLKKTISWYRSLKDPKAYILQSKQLLEANPNTISAIIACYKDEQAIPIMYERLKRTFEDLKIDYEIIFVNDGSPDETESVIQELTTANSRVLGITHTRNFGSQAAFMSGLRMASKKGCVLLDGDLQDPPELIKDFYAKWVEGYDIVYGRRVDRQASMFMRIAYKTFYKLFNYFSYIPVPRDAGDFSLLDRRVVDHMRAFPERDLFLRGIRAFVGFKQVGVNYKRPERTFGRTTNNLWKNIGWAKKGILSFSYTPLNMLSVLGFICINMTVVLAIIQVIVKVMFPDIAPKGFTTTFFVIGFFGSINLLASAIIGEYIAKIFEEVKQRPLYIRKSIIRNGQITSFSGVQ